eukprot:1002366-Alexandrium_andersonii.AAC.1
MHEAVWSTRCMLALAVSIWIRPLLRRTLTTPRSAGASRCWSPENPLFGCGLPGRHYMKANLCRG